MKFKLLCVLVSASLFSFTPPPSHSSSITDNTMSSHLPDDKKFPSLLPNNVNTTPENRVVDSIYSRMNLQYYNLPRNVFFAAYKGYEYLLSKGALQNPDYLTICDYNQSSSAKRLYILDITSCRMAYNTYVSHGKKSGKEFATSFSNSDNSNKSSLGFMITGSTYYGKAGYSLHLSGMEEGFNDHVYRRSIVMHGSSYVDAERADEDREMGRSFGCPAVPYAEHRAIINLIKEGSCFYAAAGNSYYLNNSQIINANFIWPVLQKKENMLTNNAATTDDNVAIFPTKNVK